VSVGQKRKPFRQRQKESLADFEKRMQEKVADAQVCVSALEFFKADASLISYVVWRAG